MDEHIPNLWPDNFGARQLTPVAILREQAEFLTRTTEGALRGFVQTTRSLEGGFLHSFFIQVPSLGGYTYDLFSIHHGIPVYPVTIHPPHLNGDLKATTEAELLDRLRQVLSAPPTLEVINALLSQAQTGAA
jgi:hypothetical protein